MEQGRERGEREEGKRCTMRIRPGLFAGNMLSKIVVKIEVKFPMVTQDLF
jgi:hypothetical protein